MNFHSDYEDSNKNVTSNINCVACVLFLCKGNGELKETLCLLKLFSFMKDYFTHLLIFFPFFCQGGIFT